MNIPTLDECVLSALNLFQKEKIPSLSIPTFKRPLVVGSGNAAVTGRILFADKDALFADESNYQGKIKYCDGAILISASGGKHAPILVTELRNRKKDVILLTNNPNAPAKALVTKTITFPKQTEPYTYNTSTYLGMILAKTKENPTTILSLVQALKVSRNLSKYNAFFIIIPAEFELLKEMFQTKFDELFGPMMVGRIFTPEQVKHAKTVIPSDKELFISLGYENKLFGVQRWNIALPAKVDYGLLMALGYSIIGKIQSQHPPYFKDNITRYCQDTSTLFQEKIEVWVT